MSTDQAINLLVVEDDEGDARLLERQLRPGLSGNIVVVRTLLGAVEAASITRFDAAIVDLGLPDAWGLDTLLRFARLAPDVPVIVLTGTQVPAFAEKAHRAGAVAFLAKSADIASVAAEIMRIVGELGGASAGVDRSSAGGLEHVDRVASLPTSTALFDRDLGQNTERWASLVDRYADLLELFAEQATFRTRMNAGTHLREFVTELAHLGAAPRDLVSIHTAALRRKLEDANGAGVESLLAEARLMALEAMGHLASSDRTAALGMPKATRQEDEE